MDEEKIVSVVIPMYNSSRTIVRALDSILNQIFDGIFQVIIVNDGSTDNSREIVENYIFRQEQTKTTFTLINQENGGVSKARNVGLRLCIGKYIAFLDSDDEWLVNKTSIQIQYLSRFNFDFLSCLRNQDKLSFPYRINGNKYAEVTVKKLLFKVVGQTSTAIFKRDILSNVGYFDENQRYSEDANYWMRISHKYKMVILNKTLVLTGGGKRSVGQSGLSANMKEMEEGVQKNINEMYDLEYINLVDFFFFKVFSRFKYLIRLIRYSR